MKDDDELIITWAADTLGSYDVNTMSTTTITNGGTGGTFTYGSADFMNQPSTVWTTSTTIGAAGSNYQFQDWNIGQSNVAPSGQLNLAGDNADIVINGRSLNDTLTAIQDRMNMLVPNPDMEKEWDELRELGERYRKLEKKCQEKSVMWSKLKSLPKIKQQKW